MIWSYIANFFHVVEDTVSAAVKAFAAYLSANGGNVLIQCALDAVTAAENAGGGGAAKFAAACAAVREDMFNKGIPVIEHAVQCAVLAAVSQLKAEQAKQEPIPNVPAT